MDYEETISADDALLSQLEERLSDEELQKLFGDFEAARLAFLALGKSQVPVPRERVLAAQDLIRQTQDAVRAAMRQP